MASSHSTSSVITGSVVSFLKNVPPFQFLSTNDLHSLARTMSLEYFPKDTVILSAGSTAARCLYVIQKGGVQLALRTQVGKQLAFDLRSEGEIFGVLSFMGRDTTRLDVTALEDTLCYTIPAAEMEEVIAHHPDVADYLLRTSLFRYMDRSLRELRTQTNLMGDSERLLYSIPARDVVKSPLVTCDHMTDIQEAARRVAASGTDCLCVVDENGRALGIVTDRDFTTKVAAQALPLQLPVTSIMSSPIITVDGSERVFQVLLLMLGRDIHHVLVTEDGLPKGVVNSHDLMLLQGKSPLQLVRHIQEQRSVQGLVQAQQRIAGLLPLLLREGAKAAHITRVIAEMNDHVVAKILDLAVAKLGPAPVPFCWVVLGSEGRREQTFKTDQDNALIFGDLKEGAFQEAEAYFSGLAEFVRNALVECGYPLCPGGYMASNPLWRCSLSAWHNKFATWIESSDRRSTEDALLFFDMRPVAGDLSLCDELVDRNRDLLKGATTFKSVLAKISIGHKPPLGFFRTFVVERSGEHKDELDLKLYGTGPIVNAARLYAIDQGIVHTNTSDRLAALKPEGLLTAELLRDLQEAFEFLSLLRVEMQLGRLREGQPPSNYVRPSSLNHLQRSLLKEAFHASTRVQSAIIERYESAVWPQLEP
jgi:CBS domain-containing protein